MVQLHVALSDPPAAWAPGDAMESLPVASYEDGGPERCNYTLYEFLQQEKPLPSLPSPTLTNPDMVLPDVGVPGAPSPAASIHGPPSPSYLRHASLSSQGLPRKKEKRGLMSRKMLLLRSRTGSSTSFAGGHHHHQQQQQQQHVRTPRSTPSDTPSDYHSAYASSPTLMDVGNLAPELVDEKRLSFGASSFNSDDFVAASPNFLAKYAPVDNVSTDDELYDSESNAPQRTGSSVGIEGGLAETRRQREEDEHNSAILSERAEQILANAKRRLNLMEGNLRGARDLVAPLTAANLKRATSLGSAHHSTYAARRGFGQDDNPDEPSRQIRLLHSQASSPTMGRDFTAHGRNRSDELPDRPHTALASNAVLRNGRIPLRANNASRPQALRGSKSVDSLGSAHRDRLLHTRGSPDPALGPVPEDEASPPSSMSSDRMDADRADALDSIRPTSRTEGLREQMSSLKGKISTLKERAREDNLRRQSMQSLRTASPFNNAVSSPPEMFYTQAPSHGGPAFDTDAGIGRKSFNNIPATPQDTDQTWDGAQTLTGSRNAFAQRAGALVQVQDDESLHEREARSGAMRKLASEVAAAPSDQHKRTPSGRVIIAAATNRYSHHQYTNSQDTYDASTESDAEAGASRAANIPDPVYDDEAGSPDDDLANADDGASVYADAPSQQPSVIAHEDRDDAFDYEHFFLHSAMSTYGGRRASMSSQETTSSAETARGPVAAPHDLNFDPDSSLFPPPTPETPERLRQIERGLHQRTLSADSVSTFATFATADEGITPGDEVQWPIPPTESPSRPASRPGFRPTSRPSTAIRRPEQQRRDSTDRADSGVGLSGHSSNARSNKRSPNSTFASPPLSPLAVDPATVAVNALLHPQGRQLGLKDKAVLFGLVESLRKVVRGLQEQEEGQYEARALRRQLDEARRALDEDGAKRPGSG